MIDKSKEEEYMKQEKKFSKSEVKKLVMFTIFTIIIYAILAVIIIFNSSEKSKLILTISGLALGIIFIIISFILFIDFKKNKNRFSKLKKIYSLIFIASGLVILIFDLVYKILDNKMFLMFGTLILLVVLYTISGIFFIIFYSLKKKNKNRLNGAENEKNIDVETIQEINKFISFGRMCIIYSMVSEMLMSFLILNFLE